MILEVHDSEEGNTLTGRVKDIDYDYMAEQWVQDLVTDEVKRKEPAKFRLTRFVLLDGAGKRAEWLVHENNDAELVWKSERFTGQWQMNLRFTPK